MAQAADVHPSSSVTLYMSESSPPCACRDRRRPSSPEGHGTSAWDTHPDATAPTPLFYGGDGQRDAVFHFPRPLNYRVAGGGEEPGA